MAGMEDLIEKGRKGRGLERDDALALLNEVKPRSREMYLAMQAADQLSRRNFGNIGGVLAQIGVNWDSCPANCGFCAFSESGGLVKEPFRMSAKEVAEMAKQLRTEGATALSIMTTASFPFEDFVEIGTAVRKAAGFTFPMIANIGDIDARQAAALLEAGFTGIYHCIRLGEGKDTRLDPAKRASTMKVAKQAGLMVFSCVEPIGPEHGPEEVLDLTYAHLDLGVDALATMRRVPVPGTALFDRGTITESELVRMSAIIRLAAGSEILSFGNHETSALPLVSGANTLTAEVWSNPRKGELEMVAGATVKECQKKLWEAGWSTLG